LDDWSRFRRALGEEIRQRLGSKSVLDGRFGTQANGQASHRKLPGPVTYLLRPRQQRVMFGDSP
jgi:hypothetical protein